MHFELDVDDIDLEKANRLVANLFGMAEFSIEGGMSQIDHMLAKHRISVELTHSPMPFMKWSASDQEFEFPTQYGSRAIEAAVRILLVRAFTDSAAVINFDLVFESVTPDAALQIITSGSPYHLTTQKDGRYVLRPDGNSYEDVEAFQIVVRRLLELSDLGYVRLASGPDLHSVGDNMLAETCFEII